MQLFTKFALLARRGAARLRIARRAKEPPISALNSPPLPLLGDASKNQLFDFVTSICVQDAPAKEMYDYASQDFERFLRTVGLLDGLTGRCLELGGNPYFTTLLIQKYTKLEPTVANYFDDSFGSEGTQAVQYTDPETSERKRITIDFAHFNVEEADFPYDSGSFDVVIFAEIIEHLLMDPCAVLREIRRVLKPGGHLILTTPNVARLENVARLLSGANIYDPYSGYGAYGRHNREYNQHELYMLLTHEGFEPEIMYSADVHDNLASNYWDPTELESLLTHRKEGLGQYLFSRSKVKSVAPEKRPRWLYRSYPEDELD